MTPRRRCCGRLPACLTPASVATSSLIQQRCALSTPALRGAFSCGLLCSRDAIVEPRQVPVAIRDYLLARCTGAGNAWLPGRDAVEIAPGAVRDHSGTWHRGPGQARAPASGRRGRRRAALLPQRLD